MSDDIALPRAPEHAWPPTAAATPPSRPAFAPDRRSALRRLEMAAHLAWLLPQAMTAAEQAVSGASRIAQEQALKLFETNAMLLQRMVDLLGDSSDAELLARGAEVHARKAMTAELPQGLFYIADDRLCRAPAGGGAPALRGAAEAGAAECAGRCDRDGRLMR